MVAKLLCFKALQDVSFQIHSPLGALFLLSLYVDSYVKSSVSKDRKNSLLRICNFFRWRFYWPPKQATYFCQTCFPRNPANDFANCFIILGMKRNEHNLFILVGHDSELVFSHATYYYRHYEARFDLMRKIMSVAGGENNSWNFLLSRYEIDKPSHPVTSCCFGSFATHYSNHCLRKHKPVIAKTPSFAANAVSSALKRWWWCDSSCECRSKQTWNSGNLEKQNWS